MKIILLIPYYGQWPLWFPAFLQSCRYNPHIDWCLFTDCDPPPDSPENVRFIKLDLDSFNQLCSEKLSLSIDIKPSYLYKITDFKSAFGKIFEDYIQEYDFWGHSDLDIVWGDMSKFLRQELLENFDIITSRLKKISGHFCLFRNIPEVTMTFTWIPGIASLMQSETRLLIDEKNISQYLYSHLRPNWFTRLKWHFFAHQPIQLRVYWDKVLTTNGKTQRMLREKPGSYFLWKEGKAFNHNGEEMMYIHFHELKHFMREINFGYEDSPTMFRITPSGIYTL